MIIYNKLIRDKIPEIIKADNKEYEIKILNDEEYLTELNKKLHEEHKEYDESGEVGELADLAELLYAIAKVKGVSAEEFDKIRTKKAMDRGGFEKKLFLIRTLVKSVE